MGRPPFHLHPRLSSRPNNTTDVTQSEPFTDREPSIIKRSEYDKMSEPSTVTMVRRGTPSGCPDTRVSLETWTEGPEESGLRTEKRTTGVTERLVKGGTRVPLKPQSRGLGGKVHRPRTGKVSIIVESLTGWRDDLLRLRENTGVGGPRNDQGRDSSLKSTRSP